MRTCPFWNSISFSATSNRVAAKAVSRRRIVRAAFCAAMPLRSVPDDAAVAEVLGTLPVCVDEIWTWPMSICSSAATTCATLIRSPCPISVPPWFKRTLPSLYTCNSAPAWLSGVLVKEIPNLTGVNASPRRRYGFVLLNAFID